MNKTSASLRWDEVFAAERAAIREPDGQTHGPDRPLTGLAFSGGGIRSATFNLGMLQALSELGLLRHFDYLSCVSGGGYIGGWLSAFVHRECNGRIEDAESRLHCGGDANPAIGFLRTYSNYLTPKATLLSADTLTAVATFVRNLCLNLTVLLLALGALLLLPRLLLWSVRPGGGDDASGTLWPLFGTAAALLGVAMVMIGCNLANGSRPEHPFYVRQRGVFVLVVLPLLVSAWLTAYGLFADAGTLATVGLGVWVVIGAVIYVAPWGIGWGIGRLVARRAQAAPDAPLARLAEMTTYAVLAGAIGGLLLALCAHTAGALADQVSGYNGAWIASTLLTAQVLLVYSLTVVAHIGLMGRRFSHGSREWWSRLGGWVLIVALVWVTLFGVTFLAPVLFSWAPEAVSSAGGVGWLVSTGVGIVFGRGDKTSGRARDTWRDQAAKVAPYVFIVGLLGLLSWGLHALLTQPPLCPGCTTPPATHGLLNTLRQQAPNAELIDIRWVAWLCAGGLLLAGALAWRVDVNLFSIYHFYRQRLVRCYLGASRSRVRAPQPFTGFDPFDDLELPALATSAGTNRSQRPYPIHNTTLNLVGGRQLAWQERKAAAFAFTPLACGYSFALPDAAHTPVEHFRPAASYMGGAWLGSAITVSGAAASPNMGYHSSPALTFLMTVFNVRLGHWSPNPANDATFARLGPRFGGGYLLRELFGLTDHTSPYVYLSDGGHFENLGIYELVRRRCACIVAIDAGQDADGTFEDLGNAIRKCYADFGVTIDIGTQTLGTRYCAIGRIDYGPDLPRGTLIFIKPRLLGDEPADLVSYQHTHARFPNESTADQWFDESQFESYRKLGHHIGRSVFDGATADAIHRREAAGRAAEMLLPWIAEVLRERQSQTT